MRRKGNGGPGVTMMDKVKAVTASRLSCNAAGIREWSRVDTSICAGVGGSRILPLTNPKQL